MDALTVMPTTMPTDTQILTLAQWFSPGYPVGAFAYSHGLEWAVEAGQISDADTLQNWLTDILQHGAGYNDALFLTAAFGADGDRELMEIDAKCRAFAASKERLMETDLQGAAFCKITGDVWAQSIADLTYPVAVGRAALLAGLPLNLTTRMYLHAFVSNLVAAAMRLISMGQTEGQRVIKTLTPLLADIAESAISGTLDDLSSTAFMADIAAMKHESQYSRIFRT